jgi:hypothetical protein
MDLVESVVIRLFLIKRRGAEIVKQNLPVPHPVRALQRFCST